MRVVIEKEVKGNNDSNSQRCFSEDFWVCLTVMFHETNFSDIVLYLPRVGVSMSVYKSRHLTINYDP